MKLIANRLGPFKLYAAKDVIACLSCEARNVRTEQHGELVLVLFDLPEGAKIWRKA